jgi:hypothetical protein
MKRILNIAVIATAVVWFLANAFFHIKQAGSFPAIAPLNADLYWIFYPNMVFVKRSLLAGSLPLWTPYQSTGEPMYAAMQCVLLYPFNWALFFLDVPSAMLVIQASAVLVGILGTVLYLRYLRVHLAGVVLAAIVFGYSVHYQAFNCVLGSTYAWLPVILWSGHRLFDKPNFSRAAILALSLSLCFLGGMPQYLFYICLVLLVYLTVLALSSRAILHVRPLLARAGLIVAAVVLMGGLVAAQLLPSLELSVRSERDVAGALQAEQQAPRHGNWFSLERMAEGYFTREPWSAECGQLLVLPYFGALMFLIPFAFASKRHRGVSLALAASLGYTVLFVLAKQEPALAFFGRAPFSDVFRNHSKMIAFGHFMIAALAGIGLSSLQERRWGLFEDSTGKKSVARMLEFLCVFVIWCMLFFYNPPSKARGFQYLLALLPVGLGCAIYLVSSDSASCRLRRAAGGGVALMGVIIAALFLSAENFSPFAVVLLSLLAIAGLLVAHVIRPVLRVKSAIIWGLALLVLVDLVPTRNVGVTIPATATGEIHTSSTESRVDWIKENAGYDRVFFVPNVFISPFNLGSLYEIYNINSYQPMTLARWTNFFFEMVAHPSFDSPIRSGVVHDVREFLANPEFLGLTSLRYVSVQAKLFAEENAGWKLIYERNTAPVQYVYENIDALPRAYLVSNYMVAQNEKESLQAMRDNLPALLRNMVVLENGAPSFEPVEMDGRPGTAKITKYDINGIDLDVNAGAPGLLVLTDSYYPGWMAYVDGAEKPIWRANSLFRAVEVPPGEHTVSFRYRPASLRWGSIISLTALLIMAMGIVAEWLYSRKRKSRRRLLSSP